MFTTSGYKMNIPFNKPYLTGKEIDYLYNAIQSGKISGNGTYTHRCHSFFTEKYNFKNCFLTSSCTDALEMTAILINTMPGDQIIIPSYTFVSTANAFVLRGAKIIFADSEKNTPNIDADKIEELITHRTKAIVVVHYGGVACDMDKIMKIAKNHKLFVIEDAAQSIDSYYKNRPLGSIGHLATFSFHETKNIISGEGGMLVVNDRKFKRRAEIIWEKGTNRAAFYKGEVAKYSWVDIGSSFLPSEITAAFLFAQLENLEKIQKKRINLWEHYYSNLKVLEEQKYIKLPYIPEYAANNGHLFYILCRNLKERTMLINYLKKQNIMAVFHYQSLHRSPFYYKKHDGRKLPLADNYTTKLLRLPLYYQLDVESVQYISNRIKKFYGIY
ncbi:MAG: dTDP-4-amino-4,6-dideoxygalactose transaminase [Ignavibacteria bacterium]